MFRLARHWKKLTGSVAVSAALGGAVFLTTASNKEDPEKNRQLRIKETQVKIPSREEHLAKLKSKTLFDVLVIGGGATGTGIALVSIINYKYLYYFGQQSAFFRAVLIVHEFF